MNKHQNLVGIVTPRYAPAIGGVERHVEALASGLVQRNFGVEVLTTDGTHALPGVEQRDGVVVRRFKTVGPRGAYHISPGLGAWLLRNATRYQVLHAHSYHALPALQAAIAATWNNVPLVFTAHYHGTGHSPLQRALHKPYRALGRWMVGRAGQIICVSDVERQLLGEHFGPSDRRVVIANGVDIDDLSAAAPKPRESDRVLVLSVGRLELYKQTDRLVAALPYLPSNYEAVIIGEGPARSLIEQAAQRYGVEGRLRLLGRVPQEELLAWYCAADVFVSLSQRESFGITLLEGAVAGASVVASDIAAHREVAGYVPAERISFVNPCCRASDLAQAIVRTARQGRATGIDGWPLPTWSMMVDGAIDCYRSVAGSDVFPLPLGVAR